ncbi:MAG TPA: hypothetical protein VK151_03130 [Fluviicola sp.]|nr:hypothetical protein [Fluviicola sp.]
MLRFININTLTILLFISSLAGCGYKKSSPKKSTQQQTAIACQDDYLIINSTFKHLVFPRIYLPGEIPEKEEYAIGDFGYHNYECIPKMSNAFFLDHLKGVHDRLTSFDIPHDWYYITKSDFAVLLNRLNNLNHLDKPLDVSHLTNTSVLKLVPITEKDARKNRRPYFSYSTIVYNPSHTKACFHFEEYGFGSGRGRLVFTKKINGIWVIIDVIETWIACG